MPKNHFRIGRRRGWFDMKWKMMEIVKNWQKMAKNDQIQANKWRKRMEKDVVYDRKWHKLEKAILRNFTVRWILSNIKKWEKKVENDEIQHGAYALKMLQVN